MKHTPGPWKFKPINYCGTTPVYCGDILEKSIGGTGMIIAQCNGDTETANANARLIAAAPELLEACKEMLKYIDVCNKKIPQGLEKQLRSAINHAEGRE